jgi:hypothetical protein
MRFNEITSKNVRPSFESHMASLVQSGVMRLYRVMNLVDPISLIAAGNTKLGCCWSYDLEFLRNGDHDFGFGGTPENWFYFHIDASPEVVDWDATREFYEELNDFEREVRLLPDRPIELVAISNHTGEMLDCSSVLHKSFMTGAT